MNLNGISSDPISDLARMLTKKFDTDGNGQISNDEFANVIKTLLNRTSSANLGGFEADAPPRTPVGTMAGFDPAKMADPSHRTIKYEVGRILQYYPNTPQGLRDALAEIRQVAPNATITGSKGDKIDFGDYMDRGVRVGIVDVLEGAGVGGRAWQWLPTE